MGAVSFSLDNRLIIALKSTLPLKTLVETGTFKGDTVNELMPYFERIISIELSYTLWKEAAKRFEGYPKVQIMQGSSDKKLSDLRSELINTGVVYWLDAHWCVASNTAGELSQCPLLDELRAIDSLNNESIVLIDDARLFLAPPLAPHEISQWPSLHQLIKALFDLSDIHELTVVNDMMIFYPLPAKAAILYYAQNFGFDWLTAANCYRDNESYVDQIEQKEKQIHEKEAAINEKEEMIHALDNALKSNLILLEEKEKIIKNLNCDLVEKENMIQLQARAINTLQNHWEKLTFIRRILIDYRRFKQRSQEILRPRLGFLNQYSPRPITNTRSCIKLPLSRYPSISIITPSYNQGSFIERTLLSVLNQRYPNLQYYIQDGNSTDCTLEVLRKHQHEIFGWASETDKGQAQAINRGFTKTSGEIMGWINSDDLLLPGALNTVANYFNHHPEIDVVYGNRLMIDEQDMEIGRWIMPKHENRVLSWVDYIPQETLFWRRRIWDKIGGKLDESFRFAMDWDLLVRFRDAGAKFAHIPLFIGAFRIHEMQKTSAQLDDLGRQEMDLIRKRLLGKVPTDQEILRTVRPYLHRHLAADLAFRIQTRLHIV